MLELLKQRRVWAAVVAAVSIVLSILHIDFQIDVPVVTDLLTSWGGALADLIVGTLALWSYLKPKN